MQRSKVSIKKERRDIHADKKPNADKNIKSQTRKSAIIHFYNYLIQEDDNEGKNSSIKGYTKNVVKRLSK